MGMNDWRTEWLYRMGWDGKRGSPVPGTGKWWASHFNKCHGERAERKSRRGREYWSRRASISGIAGWGLYTSGAKSYAHKVERRKYNIEMRKMLDELDI